MDPEFSRWERRVGVLGVEFGVPGVSLGVLVGGRVVSVGWGVVNVGSGVGVTAESVFKVGSITKVLTALGVLRLVDGGLVDLDARVVSVLPGFRVADEWVSGEVTLRHLLSHSSGIAGDDFADTGRGDDALERYVAHCAGLGQDVPLGATMSYSNTGFSILGRVIERVTGRVWDEAMRELVYGPLGLTRTVTLPEDALRFRTAWGHLPGPDGAPALVDSWDFPRSSGPAGSIAASARDLLTFARLFLEDGRSVDGERALSPELIAEMTRPQVAVPDHSVADHWGLGWALKDVGGRRLYEHSGNGSGQNALLQVVPDRGVAIAILTNGGDQTELPRVLAEELLRELCDLEPAQAPRPAEGADRVAGDDVIGVYERLGFRLDIVAGDGALHGTLAIVEPLASQLPDFPPRELELYPSTAGAGIYVSRLEPDREEWTPLVFVELDGERYVHFGARAMRKAA